MPLYLADEKPVPDGFFEKEETLDPEAPSFWTTFGAAMRTENVIGATISNDLNSAMYRPEIKEEGFDVLDHAMGTKYENDLDEILKIHNRKAWEMWKAQNDKEEDDRRILDAAGIPGLIAQFGAGALSPTSLLPGGAAVKLGKIGYSRAKTAAKVGALAGAGALADEAVLHSQQLTRGAGESAVAVGGTVILAALLGGTAAHYMTRSQYMKAAAKIQNEIYLPPTKEADALLQNAGIKHSIGASATRVDTLENNTIAGAVNKKLAKLTLSNPLLRGLQSPSATVRDAVTKLVENPIYLNKNMQGHASNLAVETAIKQWDRGALAEGMDTFSASYRKFRKDAQKRGIKTGLSQTEFSERVSKAMRRGDVDEVDANPFVEEAARAWREKVFDPLKDMAIEAGLLPEDVTPETAVSYLSRIYNKALIEQDEAGFKRVVREWAGGAVREDIQRFRAQGERRKTNVEREMQELELAILREEESYKQRLQRAGTAPEDLQEGDILDMIKVAQSKAPNQPETLRQFLKRRGGLFDDTGELRALGINNKALPGFVRKERRGAMSNSGGWDLDTAARMAWEEGFIVSEHRPSVNEFLDALADDFSGMRRVVREADFDAARVADEHDALLAALDQMGINPRSKDAPRAVRQMYADQGMAATLKRVLAVRKTQFRKRIDALKQRMDQLEEELANRPKIEDDVDFDDLSKAELESEVEEIVKSIFLKVTGRQTDEELEAMAAFRSRLPASRRGPMKERTFNIPDVLIEPWLENDVEHIARRYARVMATDVELTRNFGTANLGDLIQRIQDEYEGLRAKTQDAKEIARLSKAEESDVRDINAIRDLLRGQYEPEMNGGRWARIVNLANAFNYMRALGGVTLSSLPDVARPMMVHGFGRYMNDGLRPLIQQSKGWKLAVREAKIAGTVTERSLNSRLASLVEIMNRVDDETAFERFVQNSATLFSKVNMLTYWNDFMKSQASVITQNRIITNLQDYAAVTGKERNYMNYLGFDAGNAHKLLKELRAHGEQIDGVWVANTERWTDKDAVRLFRAGLNKDVDSTIVTKGIADVPLFAHTPTGRMMLQFRTFALAAHQRVLMRGMSEEKTGVLTGMIFAVTVGAMVSQFKNFEANRPVSDNPGTWIAEGLDRSGLFTIFFEMNNTAEKLGAPGVYTALQSMFPEKDQRHSASRYATRNITSSLLGPSIGPVEDFARILYSINQGDFTPGDITAIRRLMPYATLPFIRSLLEYEVMPELKDAVR